MSHVHIPDGVLPVWLWAAGWLAALLVLAVASRLGARGGSRRAVPLVGAVSALVLVSMSSEIVPIAYHINLTVVAGTLLGPWLGIISAFIVVLVLALLGHGGITVVGLNTLIIGTEMALGGILVRGGMRVFGNRRVRWVAVFATILTLALTTSMLVGIVALGGSQAATRETGALDPETLTIRDPFSEGVFSIGLLQGEEDAGTRDASRGGLDVRRFAAVVFTLGPIGWVLEALVTAAVLGYVSRVRPNLLRAGEVGHATVGDEHGGR